MGKKKTFRIIAGRSLRAMAKTRVREKRRRLLTMRSTKCVSLEVVIPQRLKTPKPGRVYNW